MRSIFLALIVNFWNFDQFFYQRTDKISNRFRLLYYWKHFKFCFTEFYCSWMYRLRDHFKPASIRHHLKYKKVSFHKNNARYYLLLLLYEIDRKIHSIMMKCFLFPFLLLFSFYFRYFLLFFCYFFLPDYWLHMLLYIYSK